MSDAIINALDTALSAIQQITSCDRCNGSGSITRPLGLDECPECHGAGSTHPNLVMSLHNAKSALSEHKSLPGGLS